MEAERGGQGEYGMKTEGETDKEVDKYQEEVEQEEEEEDREDETEEEEEQEPSEDKPKQSCSQSLLHYLVKVVFGSLASITCGVVYGLYLAEYHDRKFWFSSKQELEREISFQGGSGLYYYYFKHMLAAPTFDQGLFELVRDNRTISGQTINAVQRLSLYPELITSFMYRAINGQDFMKPIHFYVGVVFGLQVFHVTALFVSSWVLSGNWVAGVLTVSWYVINRSDMTQADHAVPQRENWALPYFSVQVASLTGFLSSRFSSSVEFNFFVSLSFSTPVFLLLWEHSHYILFVQALCLFLLDSLDLIPTRKANDLHRVYLCSLFLAYVFQLNNTSLIYSPLLSLQIGSVLAKFLQQRMKMGPLVARVMKLFLHFHLVFTTCITYLYLVKKLLPVKENDFILRFLEVKFGLNSTTDFVTNFLLCQESLQAPAQTLFLRLTQTSVLPFYLLVLSVCLLSTLQTVYRRLSGEPCRTSHSLGDGRVGEQPAITYHMLHSLFFGGLALLFDGMKYFWTPYVCVFTAFGVCSPDLFMTLIRWLRLKSVHPTLLALILSMAVPAIIGLTVWREYYPYIAVELKDVHELQDSDTVELITWIRSHTPVAAVFAGSPQLLGIIKLCSGSAVTSLPLYSDYSLLKRTEDTYQVYAMRSAESVYKLLSAHKTNYVIVEESICDELAYGGGCRVKDLLDISNGHVIFDRGEMYSVSKHGRFCQEIKLNHSPYKNYFTRVFWNRSYHVYRVNSVISFQY